jgi:hypothetical protein
MRILSKRVLAVGTTVVGVLAGSAALFWLSLTHEPSFYRAMVRLPRAKREAKAKRFVSQSIQLRNDICNEPTWEAVFSDEEVNAWLAEDLVTYFADQLPPEVHEPRVLFEMDRVTLAFELDDRPVKSVVWVVARPRVPHENVLELTIEKIRAGMLPVPADRVLDRIVGNARGHGLDVSWKREGKYPVATIRYTPHPGRDDVKLERVQIRKGELRLAGRSDRTLGALEIPTLPTRKVLQSKFPRRRIQVLPGNGVSFSTTPDSAPGSVPTPPVPVVQISTRPRS